MNRFKYLILFAGLCGAVSCASSGEDLTDTTTITKWQDGKRAAISLTYDDGTINQMTVARPIMNRFGFPGTFFVLTGKIEGSAQGQFIGRDPAEIIRESASVETGPENFFERASLIAYTGIEGAEGYHSRAGSLFESGSVEEAYKEIDEGYRIVREGRRGTVSGSYENYSTDTTTWADYRSYTDEGHEIASHTITHPRLAVLDEANLLYELEQSKADIQKNLGDKFTFSAECPYGTENERVMEYALEIYPALRNRMPARYLEELNRWNERSPGLSGKEYVQWQRGPLTDIPMEVMKAWVDTCLAHDNVWLVLVFHGVEGIGWEPRTGQELEEYFGYMHDRNDELWVATFGDVTKYIRERKNSTVNSTYRKGRIGISLSCILDQQVYDLPVTLKTYVPADWDRVLLESGRTDSPSQELTLHRDERGPFVRYQVIPGTEGIALTKG